MVIGKKRKYFLTPEAGSEKYLKRSALCMCIHCVFVFQALLVHEFNSRL